MIRVGRLATARRWRLVGALACVLTLAATSACGGAAAQWRPGGEAGQAPQLAPSALTVSHAANATKVSPADPVAVELSGGALENVTLTDAGGTAINGVFDVAKQTWTSTDRLGYNKTYTLKVAGAGDDGVRHEETRSFTTVKPKNYVRAYLRAHSQKFLDGGTFGVGQVIMVWFDEVVKDRAAAVSNLVVTTDPPVPGAWRWIDGHEVHWRPQKYWPTGTKVTVEANIYGKNLGGDYYGELKRDTKASFSIGSKSKIAIADSKTKRMKVYVDGVQITKINGKDVTAGIPISMGKSSTEVNDGRVYDWRTYTGPHVVTEKYEVKRMRSPITDKESPNYYDEMIKKAVRISGDGEYVHLADWNIPAHGKYNTSHGCINVAPAYIYWFFDNFGEGDIVDVRNTGKPMPVGLGGDWELTWAEWTKPQT